MAWRIVREDPPASQVAQRLHRLSTLRDIVRGPESSASCDMQHNGSIWHSIHKLGLRLQKLVWIGGHVEL
jgi:hypothetical protein